MHIRTFRAANLNAALEMIRDQMGPEASVLHTRQLPSRVLPLWGRRRIEVTAGLKPNRRVAASEDATPEAAAPEPELPSTDGVIHLPAASPTGALVENLISAGLPLRVANHWATQAAAGCQPISATDRAPWQDARVEQTLQAELSRWLERSVPVGHAIPVHQGHRRIVALVGPTGVGKTTTIAKLAAGFQLRQKVRVGLLTLDTFRAAAIEQLDAFARTLRAPMEVVRRADEVAGALERLGDVDLVLVDTMGQSPRGDEKIAAMARLLSVAQPDETHLVLDANNSFRAAVDILAAFKPLRPSAAIISKMDEVRRPAPVIASLIERPLEISYVTTGQMVPGDIERADARSLAAAASGLAVVGCEA